MSESELTGAVLQDQEGKDFLLVVDTTGDIKSAEDAALFLVLVASMFEFPVVIAWREHDGWHHGGDQPWQKIAMQTDPTTLRLQKIPVSFPETLRKLEEQERKQRESGHPPQSE